ncbi:MAG: hypothetical protein ACI4SG_00365 [Oligosphaeraceae bacterium]
MGFSLRRLGEGLGVGWSTLRNWEEGKVRRCRPVHCRTLSRFLSGELDGELQMVPPFSHPLGREGERRFPLGRLLRDMEWAAALYRQCGEGRLSLRREMVRGLEAVIRGLACRLWESSCCQGRRERRL